MVIRRLVVPVMFGIPIAAMLLLFLTTGDARLYYAGVIPLRPIVLLGLFSLLCLSVVLFQLRRRHRLTEAWSLLRNHWTVLLPFLLLALVAIIWAQMPNAYWGRGAYFMVFPMYSLVTFVIAMFIPFLRVVRTHWRLYILMTLIGLGSSILYDAIDPTIGSRTGRPSGLADEPNFAAFFMVNLLAGVLRYRRIYVTDLAVICFAAICTFCTLSRSGMLGLGLIFIFYVTQAVFASKLNADRNPVTVKTAVPIILAALVLAAGTYYAISRLPVMHDPALAQRVGEFSGEQQFAGDTSAELRRELIWDSLSLIQQAPIFGYGTGFTNYSYLTPHNVYFLLWIELGLPGLICYLWLLIAGFRLFWTRGFLPGQAFILGTAVNGVFSHMHLQQRPIWVLYGILLSISWRHARTVASRQTARPRKRQHRSHAQSAREHRPERRILERS